MTPIDFAAVGVTLTGIAAIAVKFIIPGVKALVQNQPHSGNGGKALEARMAGGDSATLLSEVKESRKSVEEVHDIVASLAHSAERSGELLKQVTALVVKSDERWSAVTESTQAISRMLQLHTGLLDKTSLQIDAIHERTKGSAEAIKAILKRPRRRKR